jgi:sugar/nucleoside kinase (ribokinase family)
MQSPMPVLVVGSIALDSVRTPGGEREEALGGSAAYFGVAASHYAAVRIVAVVGTDFPERHLAIFRRRGMDCAGLATAEGRTFRWAGVYADDMNKRTTLLARAPESSQLEGNCGVAIGALSVCPCTSTL